MCQVRTDVHAQAHAQNAEHYLVFATMLLAVTGVRLLQSAGTAQPHQDA
jgi:hypothetical protein